MRGGRDRVELLKLDVQGYETHVLDGMKTTFQRHPRAIPVACPYGIKASGAYARRFLADLRGLGYSLREIGKGGLSPVASGAALLHQYERRFSYVDLRAIASVDLLCRREPGAG